MPSKQWRRVPVESIVAEASVLRRSRSIRTSLPRSSPIRTSCRLRSGIGCRTEPLIARSMPHASTAATRETASGEIWSSRIAAFIGSCADRQLRAAARGRARMPSKGHLLCVCPIDRWRLRICLRRPGTSTRGLTLPSTPPDVRPIVYPSAGRSRIALPWSGSRVIWGSYALDPVRCAR